MVSARTTTPNGTKSGRREENREIPSCFSCFGSSQFTVRCQSRGGVHRVLRCWHTSGHTRVEEVTQRRFEEETRLDLQCAWQILDVKRKRKSWLSSRTPIQVGFHHRGDWGRSQMKSRHISHKSDLLVKLASQELEGLSTIRRTTRQLHFGVVVSCRHLPVARMGDWRLTFFCDEWKTLSLLSSA